MLLRRPGRRRAIVTPVSGRFESDMRAGYPEDARDVTLGSPMREGGVLANVRVGLPLSIVNRHGLVAGATGTGKTKTLQIIAGQLSDAGVPVFVADVKGDLSGLVQPIDASDPKVAERATSLDWTVEPRAHPVELLSLSGAGGAPIRATVESFGPVLLAKVLDLNETQTAVLSLVFRFCDDRDLPLLDLADLRTTLRFLTSDQGTSVLEEYGGVSKASVGVVLRSILTLEEAGGEAFFGEPAFDVADLIRRDDGRGVISLLELADVMDRPRLFSTFMLWLLARLYAVLPEIGDPDEPVLAFFFDEAHLLFDDASGALLEQVELTARLIRSKGVGVFFVTHAPTDVPTRVLSQLGNRIQHALRAFTPKDADDLRKTARTFPTTQHYDVEEALTSLGIGEALVTVLSPDGVPSPLAWTRMVPPDSRMAPADEEVRASLVAESPLRVKYFAAPDRESAHEILGERLASADAVAATPPPPKRRERSVFGTLHVSRR
jgi:DNA double-strand break repair helicase HerA and related ATPase